MGKMLKIGYTPHILFSINTFIIFLVFMAGCGKQKTMRPGEIKAIVRREIEELWNKGNLTVLNEIIALDYVRHEATEDIKGLEDFGEFVTGFRTAFPDAYFNIKDMIVEGDKVAMRYIFSGIHKGDYMDIVSTGEQITATGISISYIAGGKIKETWNYIDKLSILVQLGWWVPPENWILAYTWVEEAEPIATAPGDREENKAIARRGLEELWNTGSPEIADEIYTDNFVNHEITHLQYRDLESYKKYVTAIHSVMSDFRVSIDDIIAERDKVAARWTVSGAEERTGNYYTWGGVTIFRLAGCKIAEAWWSRDAVSIAQQMGIAPKDTVKNNMK